MKEMILSHLKTECPWRDTLYWYDTIDSTNTRAKLLAKEGAAHGTVLVAGTQTGGRGRMGRSFACSAGLGVYLSVILRPHCTGEELMHLTCAAGLAGCRAVERVCGVKPQIKWPNDLLLGGKKLGGILTELGFDSQSGLVDYAIIGIGINCNHEKEDFPEELHPIATSIKESLGITCSPEKLAAALVEAFYEMDNQLFDCKVQLMDAYRQNCATLGQEISVIGTNLTRPGKALDIDENGGLVVRFDDGIIETVSSGEVSIRSKMNA